jgi:membrane protease YdiL (CAAX protease family)
MDDSAQQLAKPKPAVARFAQTRPLIVFFLLAYAWSWTCWLIIPRIVGHRPLELNEAFEIILFLIGACGPLVSALVTRWLAYRDLRICRVWTGWKSLAAGLAFGLIAFFVATVLSPTLALVKGSIGDVHWPVLLQWSTYAVNYSSFVGGPLNEEPGWRGFALPRLQARFGPYRASMILAVLWAAWHLPLFQIPGWSSASPWQFLLILTGISFLFTAAANISKFSVIVAIVLHVFFNASSSLGNALGKGLPTRSHEMVVYTFVVCACGTTIGVAALKLRWGSDDTFRQAEPVTQ